MRLRDSEQDRGGNGEHSGLLIQPLGRTGKGQDPLKTLTVRASWCDWFRPRTAMYTPSPTMLPPGRLRDITTISGVELYGVSLAHATGVFVRQQNLLR